MPAKIALDASVLSKKLKEERLLYTAAPSLTRDAIPGSIYLFPDEVNSGIMLDREKIRSLSPLYSKLYLNLIEEVSALTSSQFSIPVSISKVLARDPLATLAHFFMDRLIRLDLLVRSHPEFSISVAAQEAFIPDGVEEFRSSTHLSHSLNQMILVQLAPLFNLKTVSSASDNPELPEFPRTPNYNFDKLPYWKKIKRRLQIHLEWMSDSFLPKRTKKIPVLSMGYATPALRHHGFYGKYLSQIRWKNTLGGAPKDAALRQELYGIFLESAPFLTQFLDAAGVSEACNREKAVELFARFTSSYYPSTFLEAIPANLKKCAGILKRYDSNYLLCSEMMTLESSYMFSAALLLGKKRIAFQEGGYDRYLDDHTWATELEYGLCDRFVSWGWDTMPDLDVCRDTPVTALPSPWLNERAQYWRREWPTEERYSGNRSYDLLLASYRVYRFPPAPSGAGISRIDHIRHYSKQLIGLVDICSQNGVKILHKPYNQFAAALLEDTFAAMQRVGGQNYRMHDLWHKGLTRQLLEQCHVVLWDTPGTSFLECLVAEIPCMLYWTRTGTQEAPEAAPFFKNLELAGIVHRTPETLVEQIRRFKQSPKEWMQDGFRREAIQSFCDHFATIDPNWYKKWEKFLDSFSGAKS